jgi:CRISPR-associated exonuclease Cas4
MTASAAGDPEGDDLVPLSALNALLYCERRAALRHLDALYVHNQHTRSGDILHRRADKPGIERRAKARVRTARGLWIVSRRLKLYGRADLIEFRTGPERGRPVPFPVEYKHGRRRHWDNDDVQLCAQALCLEEMLGRDVPAGAIYHAKSRSRREVAFTIGLRNQTEQAVARLHALLARRQVPPAVRTLRCRGCSLRAQCLPDVFGRPERLESLARRLFRPELSDPSPTGA